MNFVSLLESQLTWDPKKAKTPVERAELLKNTTLFKSIHAETASTGQTAPPDDLENVELHFTCFVEAPSASTRTSATGEYSKRLIELDGSLEGPMDHGPVKEFEFLKVRDDDRAFEGLLTVYTFSPPPPRRFSKQDVAKVIKEDFVGDSKSLEFNLMYLGPAPDPEA